MLIPNFEKLRWVVVSSPAGGNFAICQKYPTILLTQVTAIPSRHLFGYMSYLCYIKESA